MSRTTLLLAFTVAAFACASSASAQKGDSAAPTADQKSYYDYGSTAPTPAPQSFAQQKARFRAEERIARLENYRRYGLTPNRPTAQALPFTSAYPLLWLRRGTTPMVTYYSDRPVLYYSYPYAWY